MTIHNCRWILIALIMSSLPVEATGQQESAAQEKQAAESLEWQIISPTNGGFEVEFPGKPGHVPRTVKPRPDLEITVEMYAASIREGKVAFLVGFHDVQELPATDEKRQEILNGGVRGAMINIKGGELTQHEKVEIEGHPARKFTYHGTRRDREIKGQSRLILVDQRVYQISIISLASQELDPALVDRFFASFHLLGEPEDKD